MLKHLRTHMRWIMIAIVVAFLLSTFLMYSDGKSGRGRPQPSADGTMQDYVVATVNGQDLMRSALENMLRNYIQQANIRDITSTDIPFLYKAALDNQIFQLELEKEVGARNISVSDAEITAAVNEMADNFATREAFYQYIERNGIKMDDLRKDVKHQISRNKTIDAAVNASPISDDAAKEFYDMTKAIFFTQPGGFTFDVANLKNQNSAAVLRAKLSTADASWLDIISNDIPSSDIINKTGAPTFLSESFLSSDEKMRPLLTAEIDKVAPIVKISDDDYMVAVKRELIEAKEASFGEVSADIRGMLQQQHARTAYENFTKDLVSRAQIIIHDKELFPSERVSADVAVSADIAPVVPVSSDASADVPKS